MGARNIGATAAAHALDLSRMSWLSYDRTHRVIFIIILTSSTYCHGLTDADWCSQSDAVTDAVTYTVTSAGYLVDRVGVRPMTIIFCIPMTWA